MASHGGISIASILPAPRQEHAVLPYGSLPQMAKAPRDNAVTIKSTAPPYGQRKGWIPRNAEAFGDGGAFPEIHVAQYPLDMGRKGKETSKTLGLQTDADGRIKYEAVVGQHAPGKQIIATAEALKEKYFDEDDLQRPGEDDLRENAERTRLALERITEGRISAANPRRKDSDEALAKAPTLIRYTPSSQASGNPNGTGQQRIIRMVEMPKDPLEPPMFKHKRVPRGPPSPPVPVMHSPNKKLTIKDQQMWKIPPCISNWKNPKGYTIPLDKRLAADGRGLQEVQINDNFAKLSEALYIAERNAREAVTMRANVQKKRVLQEKEKQEDMLRRLAQEARMERAGVKPADHQQVASEAAASPESSSSSESEEEDDSIALEERERIRRDRHRERERDRRLEMRGARKTKAERDEQRDISERIALGEAPVQTKETLYDQRLFNQSEGIGHGFDDDEAYNIYDKQLFSGSSANLLYRPKAADTEAYGGEKAMDKLLSTDRFRPGKGFAGAEREKGEKGEARDKPVQFEKDEADPFGLDEFLQEAKSGKQKRPLDKVGEKGHMHASVSDVRDLEPRSKRSKLDFESAGRTDERDRDRGRDRGRDHRDRDRDRGDRDSYRPRR